PHPQGLRGTGQGSAQPVVGLTSGVVLDTNLLLRLFLDGHPVLSSRVEAWIRQAFSARQPELIVLPTVLTEMVFAFRVNVPPFTHAQILAVLDALLDMPFTVVERAVVEAAVEQYRLVHARDWEDCLIAAYATQLAEGRLATYDRSLSKFPGIVAVAP
ncbi:MAG: PIN domain-containing protein, partial [Tepidiformaceae bacterium]